MFMLTSLEPCHYDRQVMHECWCIIQWQIRNALQHRAPELLPKIKGSRDLDLYKKLIDFPCILLWHMRVSTCLPECDKGCLHFYILLCCVMNGTFNVLTFIVCLWIAGRLAIERFAGLILIVLRRTGEEHQQKYMAIEHTYFQFHLQFAYAKQVCHVHLSWLGVLHKIFGIRVQHTIKIGPNRN